MWEECGQLSRTPIRHCRIRPQIVEMWKRLVWNGGGKADRPELMPRPVVNHSGALRQLGLCGAPAPIGMIRMRMAPR